MELMKDDLLKIASLYFKPSVASMVNAVGFDKVATEMCKQEGTDYGSLSLPKAATVLGTKLAMIKRSNSKILSGLMALDDLN
jgi:hypothetical protein